MTICFSNMLPKMWKILIICGSFLFINNVQAQADGDCYLEGVTQDEWDTSFINSAVDDFEREIFKSFPSENIFSVEVRPGDYQKYFSTKLENDHLIISPTDAFAKYEEEQESVADPQMNIVLAFTCGNSRTKNLAFYQPVEDHNTYTPEFKQPSYTYLLPMPLFEDFEIEIFGDSIEACDTDISNTRLEFSISPEDDFTIAWGGAVSESKNKCHKAVIKTKKWLWLTSTKTYQIKVTDIGNPALSSEAEFIAEVNEQTTLPPNPHFESAYYTAKYDSEGDPHTITVDTPISLRGGCSQLKLSKDGEYEDHFDVSCVEEKVVVVLNRNFQDDVLEENPIVLVTIEATLDQAEGPGRTVLVVYLPKQECSETPTPTTCSPTVTPTECPICPTDSTPSYTCPPCNTECPSTTTECPLCSTTPTECPFTCPPCSTTPGECPSAPTECPVTCPTPEFTTESPPCVTTPSVCPSTPTECPLSCPPSFTTPGEYPSPPTECPVTCPTPEQTTECPPCSTTPGEYPSAPTECPLSCPPSFTTPGEYPSPPTECPVTCPTPEHTTECPPCSTTPGDYSTECPSFSTIPSECPPPTECPPSDCSTPVFTTCPPCLTTPEPPPPETIIIFEQNNYWYKIKSWYVGYIIGVVKAFVVPEETIQYSIEGDEDFVKCDENSGALTITRTVEAKTYNFIAYAVGVTTGTKTDTRVVIEIVDDDDTEDPSIENSLLVKTIIEEEETPITLPCRYTYCKYAIASQYPQSNDNEKLFTIENNILHVAEIKRERNDIIGMLVPQFMLHLVLTEVGSIQVKNKPSINSSHVLTKRNVNAKEIPTEWVFLPDNVPNLSNQLLMSIIIEDINNNYPVFDVGSKLIVGYPTTDLAIQLSPPYLVQVVATDLDAGENAKIQYSSNSNHFVVHPETGVIYPGEKAFDDESNLKFIVRATDRNGAEDGLATDLDIEVKPLKKENLILLTVKNLMLEEIDDKMQKLSEQADMKINYLTAAVIPLDSSKDSSFDAGSTLTQFKKLPKPMVTPKASADYYSRMVVYALDSKNEPVETDDLQEILNDSEILDDFTTDEWEPESECECPPATECPPLECSTDFTTCPPCVTTPGDECSTAGFIAAIAVLASLLVIFLIAAALLYYFKIYRVKKIEPYYTMEEDTISVDFEKNSRVSTASKYEDFPQRRPTGFVFNPPPIEEDEDEFGERKYEDMLDYGKNEESIKNGNEDFGANKVRFVDTTDDDQYGEKKTKPEDSPTDLYGDNRKSVTFKETVEKINIVVEDKQDDDILDERL